MDLEVTDVQVATETMNVSESIFIRIKHGERKTGQPGLVSWEWGGAGYENRDC